MTSCEAAENGVNGAVRPKRSSESRGGWSPRSTTPQHDARPTAPTRPATHSYMTRGARASARAANLRVCVLNS